MGEKEKVKKATGSVFNQIEALMEKRKEKDIVPLHIGDTYLPPVGPASLEGLSANELGRYSIYPPTQGIHDLRQKLSEKIFNQNKINISGPECIQITAGATNGIFGAFQALLNPGDEVLLLSPWWPVITQVCEAARITWKEVPFFLKALNSSKEELKEILNKSKTQKTKAIYYSSPNNPTGIVLNKDAVEAIAEFALDNNLFVISDEAYEEFIYTDKKHISIASLPHMHEKTVSVFTFSKLCAVSGYRIGYVVSSENIIAKINKIITGCVYSAPLPAQILVLRALNTKDQWFPPIKKRYKEEWTIAKDNLQVPFVECESGYFIFLDLSKIIKENEDIWDVVEKLLDSGVSATPGIVSGPSYSRYLRICFVSVNPQRLKEGIQRINNTFNLYGG